MGKRTINMPQAVAFYVAAILGSGVLFLSGTTANVAGPASILSWALMVLFSFPLAYAFASMSRYFPDAGGVATFVSMAFGRHPGALVGWFYFFCAAIGQIIVSLTGATYVGRAFDLSSWQIMFIALTILFVASVTNYFGVRVSGKLSLVLSSCLLGLLVVTIVATLPKVEWSSFTPFFSTGWLPVGTAMTMILWSFFGWEAICNLADRFKRPERDIVRSSLISAAIIGVSFLLLSFVTVGTNTYGGTDENLTPVGVMIRNAFGFEAQVVTAVLAFIICLGTVNAFVASLAQLGFALSRDGVFPEFFSRLHPRHDTASRVVILVALFAGAGVVGISAFSIPFDKLVLIVNPLGLAVYILSMAAGLKLFPKKTRMSAACLICLIVCVGCYPFFGLYMVLPAVVGSGYFLYMRLFRNPRKGLNADDENGEEGTDRRYDVGSG